MGQGASIQGAPYVDGTGLSLDDLGGEWVWVGFILVVLRERMCHPPGCALYAHAPIKP